MRTAEPPAPLTPAARRSPRGLGRLCRTELLLFLREPAAVFFTLVFPMAMLLFLGVAYGTESSDGVRYIDEYVAHIVVTVAINLGVLGVAVNIAECRVSGVLRRYRLAPAPMWWFWLSQVVVGLLMFALAVCALLAVVAAAYGVVLASPAAFALAVLVGLAFTFATGVLLGSLDLSARGVQITGTGLFFVLFLGSGAAVPRDSFPDWLRTLTAFNPMSPVVDASVDAYLGRSMVSELPGLALVLAAAAALVLTARSKSTWEGNR
ncbi:ABC transporter permease [Streptomyces sp. TRM 70361]|uniref:ABC transporter permease n=1 Tax=Streptomyces sp. TRM 70361 TaxID=3116553 RepID=UPI002E7C4161|nr:ABC transporter permease [Streptomyces sp. TRM 70361]MEE1940888.1 ABC transporter permease [Streptomyces sp. TRM 70361]